MESLLSLYLLPALDHPAGADHALERLAAIIGRVEDAAVFELAVVLRGDQGAFDHGLAVAKLDVYDPKFVAHRVSRDVLLCALLDQHLARAGNKLMHLLFHVWRGGRFRAAAARAGQAGGGAKQSTDQRSLRIGLAAVRPQVHAIPVGEGSVVLSNALVRQAGHFFRRSGDRATTIVTARFAGEARNLAAQVIDFAVGTGHARHFDQGAGMVLA